MIALLLTLALGAELVVVERAEGDPVADAVVSWEGGEARTGRRGRVEVPDGPLTVAIAAAGFEPATHTLEDGETGTVRVWLDPAPVAFEVVVEGLRPSAHTTRHVVDGEQALETPGNHEDAVRLVQSLPGVAVQREYAPGAGDLVVRGAAPAESRYYLDGIEIPYLYHFNQYASVFPASQLDSLELFPSTFGAAYGDAVGAVVEARSPLERPETLHGSVGSSFVMGGGDLKAPVGDKGWVSVTGRRSYLDFAGENSTQYPRWPRFWDFGLRAEHGDEDGGTGVFAWGAGDGWSRVAGELDVLDPVQASNSSLLDFKKGFQVVGGRHHWSSPEADGRTVLAWVHHVNGGSLTSGGSEDWESHRLVSRTDASWRLFEDLGLDAGWQLIGERAGLEVEPSDEGLLVAEELPWLGRGDPIDDALFRGRAAAYTTAHWTTGPVRWMPGVRLSADSAGATVLADPRSAVRLSLGEQTVVKLGGGLYHQRPDSAELMAVPDLPTTRSVQAAAGIEQTVAGRLELGLELWRKWLNEPLFRPVDALPSAAVRGDGMGVELVSRYRLRERFFVWGWFALSRTTLEDGTGALRFSDGDQPIQGGAVASWDVGRWNLGLRYRYGSGLPWTPIEGSVYDANRNTWIPDAAEDNSARFPAYQKLDIRTAYTAQFRGWRLQLSLEVWFVPATSAQLYPVWNYDYREQGWVTGPTLFPLLSGRAHF